ncbi:MAG: hypothetical protein QOE06_2746 [Thermoleophilaceae bacterium]|jgi:hypothetical protein|nr:hypothetical protein [Thermoleophilaceae bacterium]
MRFSNRQKALLGVASIWPAVWTAIFLAGFMLLSVVGPENGTGFTVVFYGIFAGHVLTIIETFVVIAYYIVWMMKQDQVPDERKTLWVVILLMGNALALPIFWFVYVLRERPLAPPPQPPVWMPAWQPPPQGWQPPPQR